MITAAQRAIVSSTVPLLEQGGEALTTHFYKMLLAEHPEVRPFFNEAHQAKGDQPRALANGVLMYAKNIDRLEAMGPLAAQIVNKHVALQVMPEHYPIVGACLLRAIRDVLGAGMATDEVIDAWAAAYGQLADILIGAEKQLYDAQAGAPGGWRGERAFTVLRKVPESAEITSFHLAPADGGALMDFVPGQYIGLRVDVDGKDIRRNYSLSAAPNGKTYRISVKREPGGVASGHLHDRVQVGDTLRLTPPSGEFVLAETGRPVVLISGGVGITPTLAMLEQALATGREVVFIHCARNGGVHAFREQVDAAAARHPRLQRFYCYDEAGDDAAAPAPHAVGRLDLDRLNDWLPTHTRDVDAYFLGPKPFMQQVRRGLRSWGVPDAQSRFEFFGPASALE
ncbi:MULTISPECIES: NO-inducible flavohemoprotein [unclassified Variovorax]|uniref:NO-inducible flavohemoprotein n=1 Tax=unclassified Variovorax TaxID=663243 RepID=UPI003F453E6D